MVFTGDPSMETQQIICQQLVTEEQFGATQHIPLHQHPHKWVMTSYLITITELQLLQWQMEQIHPTQ